MCKTNWVAADFLRSVNMAGIVIEKLEMLCCLGDVLCTENGVQKAVTPGIRTGWKRFKDVAAVLCKKKLLVKWRELVYKMYIRSAMSYRAEC